MSHYRWLHGIRVRLTLSYVAAMLVVLAVYAGTVLSVVNRSALRALEERIRADFMWASEMYEERANGELSWFDADSEENDEEHPWLRVWRADGALLFQTAVARRNPLPDSAALARTPSNRFVRVDHGGIPFLVLSRAMTIRGRSVVIQVARSEASMRRDLSELVLVLALGLPLAVTAAALGGYALARRALAPVGRMADRARTITATRLSDRLPVDNPHDELGELALVFNRTLERLQGSFDQMRRFTADVSHELRTPLTAMRTVGEVALRQPRTRDEYLVTIGSMLEDADRLGTLVDRLLALSRATAADHTRIEPIELGSVAETVATHLRVLSEERRQTIVVTRLSPAPCMADPMMLRHALINLVDNAIKYSGDGAHIEIVIRANADTAAIDVVDNGPGIPPDQRLRIFERCYRGPHQGTPSHGLGLAIARAAVEANGGTLDCDATVATGSRFRIRVPRLAADASAIAAMSAAFEHTQTGDPDRRLSAAATVTEAPSSVRHATA